MKIAVFLFVLWIFMGLTACGQNAVHRRGGLTGNNIVSYVQYAKNSTTYIDPVDDTINYKKVVDNIYKDKKGRAYLLNVCLGRAATDTTIFLEYFKDVSDFLNLKTYKKLSRGYFQNKGKVYVWWGNSDGDYPIEIKDADPSTFLPFDSVVGGKDKKFVFYGGGPGDFSKIEGADPSSIKVLNPKNGCGNCGNCYFVDSKNVFYGLTKIEGADPKTFRLLNSDPIEAADKNFNYVEGKRFP